MVTVKPAARAAATASSDSMSRNRLLRRLPHREAPVEPEREALRHRAVARGVEHGPRGRTRTSPEERMVSEAVTGGVASGRFGEDRALRARVDSSPSKGIEPWHERPTTVTSICMRPRWPR